MFKLILNTDNAAFDSPTEEIARILRALADKVESGAGVGPDHFAGYFDGATESVRDINGNRCGIWGFRVPSIEWFNSETPEESAAINGAQSDAFNTFETQYI